MPITIALAGQKGGTGKSTAAIAVTAELITRGYKVLLVDADPQGTARTWATIAADAGHPAPTVVAMNSSLHRPGQLDELARPFDFAVIDCPPRHGDVMRAVLMVADVAVLPCGPSVIDGWALAESLELVRAAQGIRPQLKACVLITKKIARTALGNNAREVLAGAGLPVLSSELHSRVAYQEAPATGLGIAQYAPGTPAAAEVIALVDEILNFNQTGETHGQAETRDGAPQAA
jgi:chromosome partitioning protein